MLLIKILQKFVYWKLEKKTNEIDTKLNLLSRQFLNSEKYSFVIIPGDGLSILNLELEVVLPITYKTKKILEIDNQEEFDKFFLENKCANKAGYKN